MKTSESPAYRVVRYGGESGEASACEARVGPWFICSACLISEGCEWLSPDSQNFYVSCATHAKGASRGWSREALSRPAPASVPRSGAGGGGAAGPVSMQM
ncbi:hypothetical protein GCM10010216_13620 [Streptomyces flaveolus]|nr:hypothetical protein GCM10010216_13620 [Streptomyces flaveolus]